MFTRNIRLREAVKTLSGLNQHFEKGWLIQKKYKHHCFCEPQYQGGGSGIEKSKRFPYKSIAKPVGAATEEEKQTFMSIWLEATESFVNARTDIPELKEHYIKLLQENVVTNNHASGILVLTSYKMFEESGKLTPENIKLACILGWCVNMIQSVFMITEDVMNCYTRKTICKTTVNDASLIKNGMYLFLRKHFSGHHCHFPALQHFHDVNMKTGIGQYLDKMVYGINKKPSLASFTMDKYKSLAKYKRSYPDYILPVILGMYLAGKYDPKLLRMAKLFLCELGLYFNVQNDVLDCYGNPAITGKDGTDIREGKCTCLVIEALKRGNSRQKQILSEHYGRFDQESELKVRKIFDELGLFDQFFIYEEDSYNAVCQMIQQISRDFDKEFFVKYADAAYEKKYIETFTGF